MTRCGMLKIFLRLSLLWTLLRLVMSQFLKKKLNYTNCSLHRILITILMLTVLLLAPAIQYLPRLLRLMFVTVDVLIQFVRLPKPLANSILLTVPVLRWIMFLDLSSLLVLQIQVRSSKWTIPTWVEFLAHGFKRYLTNPILCHEFVNWEMAADDDDINRIFRCQWWFLRWQVRNWLLSSMPRRSCSAVRLCADVALTFFFSTGWAVALAENGAAALFTCSC